MYVDIIYRTTKRAQLFFYVWEYDQIILDSLCLAFLMDIPRLQSFRLCRKQLDPQ